jgi:hypothetical protein
MMPTPWIHTLDLVDEFTGWTPNDFYYKFYDAYGAYPTYQAASSFASGLVVMAAIEKTQSLDPLTVANAIETMSFQTLYRNITFVNNQADVKMVIVQMPLDLQFELVYPTPEEGATLVYPMPSWSSKSCEFSTNSCAGHGKCNDDGNCVCDPRYYGLHDLNSCDTFCHGEISYDSDNNEFCKNITHVNFGGVLLGFDDEERELLSMMLLAVELINNKADGWFDEYAQQVLRADARRVRLLRKAVIIKLFY